ncbi:E3 ubiquitin-protein ligase MARCHF9-like [Nerophis lumbriciformis]|uniref:E3 ubiquitin-protein ligase MARCHF9-like n=1 Tax=Nerophis lumbriciformis TaxID=546530 RepID=UPI002ADF0F06|nr:E3 ubiquitin-protein ligase MARCHF9-like [Nerophis lumbriciformis]
MGGLVSGCATWSHQGEEEVNDGAPPPRSLASIDREGKQDGLCLDSLQSLSDSGLRSPQCRICFQGSEKGELLSPCRCAGSVRFTHQACLIRWISEKGSWNCELCYFKYRVRSLYTKNPLQWQAVSLSLIEKVQISAIVLSTVFLLTSMAWLIWSVVSIEAKWQRQDFVFQICYGLYGFMDLICTGLLIHEGPSVFRILKRWHTINHHWKVLNYEKERDLVDAVANRKADGGEEGFDDGQEATRQVRTSVQQHLGNSVSYVLNQLRPNNLHHANHDEVMRVTTV